MTSPDTPPERVFLWAEWSRWLAKLVWAAPCVTLLIVILIGFAGAGEYDAGELLQAYLFSSFLLTAVLSLPSLWVGLLVARKNHSVLRWVAPLRTVTLAAIGVVVIVMTECSVQTGIWPAPYIPFPWASPGLLLLCVFWCVIAAVVNWRWSVDVRRSSRREARWGDYLFLTELFWLCPWVPSFSRNLGRPVIQVVTSRWTGLAPTEAEAFGAWWKLVLISLPGPLLGYVFGLLIAWMFQIDGWGMIAVVVYSFIVAVVWTTAVMAVSLVLGMWLALRRRSLIKWVAPQMAVVLGFLAFVNVELSMAGLRSAHIITGVTADQLNFIAIPVALAGALAVTVVWGRWAWRKAGELQEVERIEAESRVLDQANEQP